MVACLPPNILWRLRYSNSMLDEQLKERDIVLGVLKKHLRVVHDKMKKYADLREERSRISSGRHGLFED